ncbi:alkyl sulfatase dimerization domain-containing protein [Enterococcus asini]|uniref:alkyl/aryl-sulfatase n=1 Tax=Enterococcus asini TaxID=57732 RepID=UPI00288D78C1|nr:alkyl sulfatase dimerization domain-containing protein [Enterococcus asini]MDT2763991.1 alkyl sulfatase dimerization domain-containing protein [Enterococcus asini]
MQMKASHHTQKKNQQVRTELPFDENQELFLAKQNCVASFNHLEIKEEDWVIWSQKAYEFLEEECPDCANPSLWENARCNHQTGLFQVSPEIFQIRGFDMANLTLVLTPNRHWVVFDTLMSIECSRAAIEFANGWFAEHGYPIVDQQIAGIVISHSHVDHFGGIRGLFPDFTLDPQVPIYVPTGFTEAAIAENLITGQAMGRRSNYQYGPALPKAPTGALAIGIGQGQSLGTVSFELPTHEITENGTIELDGLLLIMQLTPGTEAPAEMNTYLPQYQALWMAENCTCTMHNLYTLRGAQVRDANEWAKYLLEANHHYGKEAKILFHAHTWPRYATPEAPNEITDYLTNQARLYKGIHDQTLKAINQGYTINEVAQQIALPKELTEKWYLRPYYGTLEHNSKAVYQKYMGWYDSNPVNLNPLTPEEEARKFVAYMGGGEKLLLKAQEDYEAGDYQWVAKVTNLLVFAEPENQAARQLCAQALTQLGYQAESGTWRNEYLVGALELLEGAMTAANFALKPSTDLVKHLSGEMILNYLSIHSLTKELELSTTLAFTDDWRFTKGQYQKITSYYEISYWHGIVTYTPLSSDAFQQTQPLYQGPRLGLLQKLLHEKDASLAPWEQLFTSHPGNRYFSIVEP